MFDDVDHADYYDDVCIPEYNYPLIYLHPTQSLYHFD